MKKLILLGAGLLLLTVSIIGCSEPTQPATGGGGSSGAPTTGGAPTPPKLPT